MPLCTKIGFGFTPVPETLMAAPPPVWSPTTLRTQDKNPAVVGAKCTFTVVVAPGATVPLVGEAVYPVGPEPPVQENDVYVSVALPLLLIVNVRSADDPRFTLPKARFPETLMILVAAAGGGVGAVDEDDPHDEAISARLTT